MHSLAPYCVRVFDPKLPGPTDEKYHALHNIRGHDLVDLLNSFGDKLSKSYVQVEEDKVKKTFKFTSVIPNIREIYGFTEAGVYGIKGKVVNVKSGTLEYKKTQNDADLSELYFHFNIPYDSTIGVCVFHNIHGRGVKSVFLNQFNEYFREVTHGLTLQIKPLTYMKVVENLMRKSEVKELRLKQYTPVGSVNDLADKLGEHSNVLIMKPTKKAKSFGNFWDFYKSQKHEGKYRGAIELLEKDCISVSAVVDFEGKKRVFSLSENSSPVSSIEFDEDDVEMDQGAPKLESLNKYTKKLLNDLLGTV